MNRFMEGVIVGVILMGMIVMFDTNRKGHLPYDVGVADGKAQCEAKIEEKIKDILKDY